MTTRDRAIIEHLRKFRCMTRDDIAEIHFSNVKRPIRHVNEVLLRLRRDDLITADTTRRKYIYFPIPRIKEQSAKMMHYLAMVDFYREIRKHGEPAYFEIEQPLGADIYPQPDIEMVWRKAPFFVEVQRNPFNDKEIKAKIERYDRYFYSKKWQQRPWQSKGKEIFPNVLMITDKKYQFPALEKLEFAFMQFRTVAEFLMYWESLES